MSSKRECEICSRLFPPCPKVPNHKYCGDPECKKEARRRWKKKKYQNDKEFRLDQADYYRTWMDKNPDYWRKYREKNPEYVEKNRRKQRERNARRKGCELKPDNGVEEIAKGNELPDHNPIPAGLYKLVPLNLDGIAKGNELIARIEIISNSYQCKTV